MDENPVSTDLLRDLVDALPSLLAVVDADERNVFTNRACVAWLGIEAEQARGLTVAELLGPEGYDEVRDHVRAALAGHQQTFERTMPTSSGRIAHTSTVYLPRRVDGRPAGYFVLVHDITSRVQAETRRREAVVASALVEEGSRLACAVQDDVVQRLYALALLVERTGRRHGVAGELHEVAEAVDELIEGTRQSVKRLALGADTGLSSAALGRVVEDSTPGLPVEPRLSHSGPLHTIPTAATAALLQVLSEALSNIVRHAAATEVSVDVRLEHGQLDLVVQDDGRGAAPSALRSALGHEHAMVASLGGSLVVERGRPRGTVVRLRLPTGP